MSLARKVLDRMRMKRRSLALCFRGYPRLTQASWTQPCPHSLNLTGVLLFFCLAAARLLGKAPVVAHQRLDEVLNYKIQLLQTNWYPPPTPPKSNTAMTDLRPNAQEDKDVESVSDSPGPTQKPLQSHTSSLKNNAAGLSSDEHENPLNGAQSNPFVYSSVPAVPHAGNSLPSGARVNGPGSHPTSEVRCVLNKGSILSNNVLDTKWQPEKDTSPEVLPPPSELQSDAWKNTAGPVLKTLAPQSGANTPLSDSEENGSKLPYSTLSGDTSDQMHIRQPLPNKAIKTGSPRDSDAEFEYSSDDYADTEVTRWDSPKSLRHTSPHGHKGTRKLGGKTGVLHQSTRPRRRMHSTDVSDIPGPQEQVGNSLSYPDRHLFASRKADRAKKRVSRSTRSDSKYSAGLTKGHYKNTALVAEQPIYGVAQIVCNEEHDPEDEDKFSTKPENLKTQGSEHSLLFFPCTICSVKFKEKGHLHRHMMYHSDSHSNQVNCEDESKPYVCRECGCLFYDSNSLMKHIIIHQERLEEVMEKIQVLKKLEHEDRYGRFLGPHCVFECNCAKSIVQHAKTRGSTKHRYCCDECDYTAFNHQALEAHSQAVHLNTHEPKYYRISHAEHMEELNLPLFRCELCPFTSQDAQLLDRHSELEHQESSHEDGEKPVLDEICQHTVNYFKKHPKTADSKPTSLTYWWSEKADVRMMDSDTPSSGKMSSCLKSKGSADWTANVQAPSLWKIDMHGILSPRPADSKDITRGCKHGVGDDLSYNCKVSGSSVHSNRPSDTDGPLSAGEVKNNLVSRSSPGQANQNPPSKSQTSTPLHNTVDKINDNASPRLNQKVKKQTSGDPVEGHGDIYDCNGNTAKATANFPGSRENTYARSYPTQKQRSSDRDRATHAGETAEDDDDEDDDCSDIQQLVIKEEYVESAVSDEPPASPSTPESEPFDILSVSGFEHKPCPYCPAVFESGVGLSNHVRGHLHRVGLSYNARHVVSPQQVALQDRQPRVRKRVPSGTKRLRKATKPESQKQHTCPLCRSWFDTKTGLSNHARGHLKRIGKTISSTNKSPVCILNELLQDKREHQDILQVLSRKRPSSRPFVSQKIVSSNGSFLRHTGISMKIQYGLRDPTPMASCVPKQEVDGFSERKTLQVEAQGASGASSTLVELLQTLQNGTELKGRDGFCPTRRHFNIAKGSMEEMQVTSVESSYVQVSSTGLLSMHREKMVKANCQTPGFKTVVHKPTGDCGSNCTHCNTNCHTGISLSSHFRTYAPRKKITILERASYDLKQKKPRLRPGLKRKVCPLNAVKEMYRLTCRFCDLVFQGPLSVQEDWIKHLQRHLMHTSVPHSGTGMVEVLGLQQEINYISHENKALEQNPSTELSNKAPAF